MKNEQDLDKQKGVHIWWGTQNQLVSRDKNESEKFVEGQRVHTLGVGVCYGGGRNRSEALFQGP